MKNKIYILSLMVLTACNSTESNTPPIGPPTEDAAISRIEISHDGLFLGVPVKVQVEAFNERNEKIDFDASKLIWKTSNPSVFSISEEGYLIPKSKGEAILEIATPDRSVVSIYNEKVFSKDDFIVNSDSFIEPAALTPQAALGHSYIELNSNWEQYVNRSLNLSGNYCGGDVSEGSDCGECTAIAKAFGNNTPNTMPTQRWYRGVQLLTRGSNPKASSSVVPGDSIATMEYINGAWRYSLSDGGNAVAYPNRGHVALFAKAYNNGIFVREQNWEGKRKVGARVAKMPTSNGTPYCSSTVTTDPNNICNYYKVEAK